MKRKGKEKKKRGYCAAKTVNSIRMEARISGVTDVSVANKVDKSILKLSPVL